MIMPRIESSAQFKKDYRNVTKRGWKIELLNETIGQLAGNIPPDEKHRDHELTGKWTGYRECHIKPDWLFIYKIKNDILYCVRTGSHSDLFG
jgi:mRNA interferase YafQ